MIGLLSSENMKKCGNWFKTKWGIATIVALVVVSVLLYLGHLSHLKIAALYIMILACPASHLFMNHGHGGTKGESRDNESCKLHDTNKHDTHDQG